MLELLLFCDLCLQLEYTKPDTASISSTGSDAPDAMKIIHKEQEMLTCFCINEVKLCSNLVSLIFLLQIAVLL